MLKVLVAEDEPWIRAAIVEMVESFGHDIKVVGDATNGIEAWHMIQQLVADCIDNGYYDAGDGRSGTGSEHLRE